MPRYYCDYCDNYLTHDSPSVRKQHNAGFKHKANVRAYYLQFEQQETEDMLEKKMAANMALAMRPGGFGQPAVLPNGTPPLPRAGLVRPPMVGAGCPPAGLTPPVAGLRQVPPPGMGLPPPGAPSLPGPPMQAPGYGPPR